MIGPTRQVTPTREERSMARLEVLTADRIRDPELRAMMEASGDEMYGVYGHCPDLFKAFLTAGARALGEGAGTLR